MADWDSLESHEQFIDHPSYASIIAESATLEDGDGSFYHVSLHSPTNARTTTLSRLFQPMVPAVTQLQTLYFLGTISPSDAMNFFNAWRDCYYEAVGNFDGLRCVGGGWAVESLDRKEISGGSARAFCIVEGWESEEKLQAFRKTEIYKGVQDLELHAKVSETWTVKLVNQSDSGSHHY